MSDQQQVPDDALAQLEQANRVVLELLRSVTPRQMALPTVSDEWDVRALINHLVLGNDWTVQTLRHGASARPSGDAISDREPVAAYVTSAEAMLAAFREPGALAREVAMPFGAANGAALAAFRFGDLVAHAWDLARATGQSTDIAPELCEAALVMARQRLAGRAREPLPFKEEIPAPPGASAADRLAAYLGKPVGDG